MATSENRASGTETGALRLTRRGFLFKTVGVSGASFALMLAQACRGQGAAPSYSGGQAPAAPTAPAATSAPAAATQAPAAAAPASKPAETKPAAGAPASTSAPAPAAQPAAAGQ